MIKTTTVESDLKDRRGYIQISRALVEDPHPEDIKIFFSNFYPIALDTSHDFGAYGVIRYYGLSEHFEIVKPMCACPEYQIYINYDSVNNKSTFEKIEKL